MSKKRKGTVELPIDERFVNKNLTRFFRVDGAVVYAPFRHDGKSVERRAFVRVNVARLPVPEGIAAGSHYQFFSDFLDPFGLYFCDCVQIRPRRLKPFGADDPSRFLFQS